MVVHPAPGIAAGTLVNALLHHCGDTPVGGGRRARGRASCTGSTRTPSGLLVVAKIRPRASRACRAVRGAYGEPALSGAGAWRALEPPTRACAGMRGVSFRGGRHPADRHRPCPPQDRPPASGGAVWRAGRHAVTRARVLEAFGTPPAAALVECWLETGRTHQIRVHMAHAGHGLIGDQTYGGRAQLSAEGAVARRRPRRPAAFPGRRCTRRPWALPIRSRGEALEFDAPLPHDMAGAAGCAGAAHRLMTVE